jgi:hypothetical protein
VTPLDEPRTEARASRVDPSDFSTRHHGGRLSYRLPEPTASLERLSSDGVAKGSKTDGVRDPDCPVITYLGAASSGFVLTCPAWSTLDKHELAAKPKKCRVGRLILDRPALRDPMPPAPSRRRPQPRLRWRHSTAARLAQLPGYLTRQGAR